VTKFCRNAEKEMKVWIADPHVTEVIHAQRWSGYRQILEDYEGAPKTFASLEALYTAQIDDLVELYRGFKGRIVIVNPPPVTNLVCLARPWVFARSCPMPSRIEELTFAAMLSKRPSWRMPLSWIPKTSFARERNAATRTVMCPSIPMRITSRLLARG
jgi:hypothetical protein